ncbi:MAG: phBC6A51 family helix-turn-helix protein [Candidatus Aerophobetes bacterium]|nr:phBC6A51 family helix-turn-helix protein [Candidatus Aerophobetes bacterium]
MKPYKSDEFKRFFEVYKRKACNVTAACDAVGISRQTYYEWRKEEEFTQKCEEAEESLLDMAEVQLIKNIREGNERALEFYLCNRAPNRWKKTIKQDLSSPIKVEPELPAFITEEKLEKVREIIFGGEESDEDKERRKKAAEFRNRQAPPTEE